MIVTLLAGTVSYLAQNRDQRGNEDAPDRATTNVTRHDPEQAVPVANNEAQAGPQMSPPVDSPPPADFLSPVNAAPPVDFLMGTVYPDLPLDVYLENVEAANDGDVEAQYRVFQSLDECDHAVRNEEDLEFEDTSRYPSGFQEEMTYRYHRCKDLHAMLQDDLKTQKNHWYSQALRAGHPLVAGHYSLLRTTDLSMARISVTTALTSGKHEAFELAAIYVGKTQGDMDPLKSLPWEYLGCERNPGCSIEAFEEQILTVMHQHDIEDIVGKARAIEMKITQRDFLSLLPTEDGLDVLQ